VKIVNISKKNQKETKRHIWKLILLNFETNSKTKNTREFYRGINDFKKGYEPRNNTVKDEKANLFADSHSILARWRKYFSQLFIVRGVNDVRQTEIHTA
jgi:hypothetical protein